MTSVTVVSQLVFCEMPALYQQFILLQSVVKRNICNSLMTPVVIRIHTAKPALIYCLLHVGFKNHICNFLTLLFFVFLWYF